MAGRGKNRDDRAAQERARVYAARREYHEGLTRRRSRDNVIAAVAGGVLIAGVVAAQIVYFTAGPGAPAPGETPEPSPSATAPADPATPGVDETISPDDGAGDAPSPTSIPTP